MPGKADGWQAQPYPAIFSPACKKEKRGLSMNESTASKTAARPILIGLMGSGKSSIGRRLAARLDLPLIDLDDYIVEKAGLSIPEIFSRFGEEEFRRRESEALAEVVQRQAIIATGGGVVMSPENRKLLKENPPVIWLQACPEFLADRIDGDSNRPLVAAGDTLNRLKALAEVRDPLYRECADLCLARDSMKKWQAVEAIVCFLNDWQGSG